MFAGALYSVMSSPVFGAQNAVVGDIGRIFGMGFVPFQGIPFHYINQVGASNCFGLMNGFAEKYEPRFLFLHTMVIGGGNVYSIEEKMLS